MLSISRNSEKVIIRILSMVQLSNLNRKNPKDNNRTAARSIFIIFPRSVLIPFIKKYSMINEIMLISPTVTDTE